MTVIHIFSDGTERKDLTGVKVPVTRETTRAYKAITDVAARLRQAEKTA